MAIQLMTVEKRLRFEARKGALIIAFPEQFAALPADRFELAPGWIRLFEALCAMAEGLLAKYSQASIAWLEIKEKGGQLRIYWETGDGNPAATEALSAEIREVYIRAVGESAKCCVVCGAPGCCRPEQDWKMPVCDAHASVTRAALDRALYPRLRMKSK